MVKAKGNVNTPMAQLVEVALEEESSFRSERFKEAFQKKGSLGIKELGMYHSNIFSLRKSE
jgi:hypothetical protein